MRAGRQVLLAVLEGARRVRGGGPGLGVGSHRLLARLGQARVARSSGLGLRFGGRGLPAVEAEARLIGGGGFGIGVGGSCLLTREGKPRGDQFVRLGCFCLLGDQAACGVEAVGGSAFGACTAKLAGLSFLQGSPARRIQAIGQSLGGQVLFARAFQLPRSGGLRLSKPLLLRIFKGIGCQGLAGKLPRFRQLIGCGALLRGQLRQVGRRSRQLLRGSIIWL